MKLFQLKPDDVKKFATNERAIRAIVVESQNYGNPEDLLYHLAVSDESAELMKELELGREIEDKGRTVGFWQNLGGEGIHKPALAALSGFPEKLASILGQQPESKISIPGATWAEIIENAPFTREVKDVYLAKADIQESSEGSKPANKPKRKRGSRKQQVERSN